MAVTGSITKTSSTETSITFAWSITTSASSIAWYSINGPNGYSYELYTSGKPKTGSATITGLTAGTAYTFYWSAEDNAGGVGGGSTSLSTSAPANVGKAKYWNGSAWVYGTVQVWNGSAWVTGTVKVWNGSSWVTSV